jgi:2-polyprenyl-6-methoxyphenol hydroxylase-like FAD-dependent oxidoreductase
MSVKGNHAIVVGGSVAGLPTAKVLSRYFDRVTIVERDDLPEHADHHRGVPQSPHLHGLLYGGRMALDEIYDGGDFTAEMRAVGGPYFDFARHQAFRFPEGWIKRAPGDLMIVFATRWTMEHVIRTLTKRVANISFEVGQVVGLTAAPADGRITGVKVRGEDGERVIQADLVVDAAGRASKSPKWLEEHGYAPPVESVVRSFLGYATVYGHVPEDAWPGDIKSIAAPPFPGTTRGGFVVPQENGLVGFMAAGQSRDYPPGDREGFTEFLRTAITPVLAEMWEQCEPATEIKTTKTSHNRLRRWHELERRPNGFIPVGDAVAAFNPVYGQGVTTASMQAKALGEALDEHDTLEPVVQAFAQTAMNVCQFAWTAATDADMSFAGTEVENLQVTENDPAVTEYFSKMRLATTIDAGVAQAFFTAQGNMKGELLFDPELMARVEEVCANADTDGVDNLRPPAYSDDEAPVALV